MEDSYDEILKRKDEKPFLKTRVELINGDELFLQDHVMSWQCVLLCYSRSNYYAAPKWSNWYNNTNPLLLPTAKYPPLGLKASDSTEPSGVRSVGQLLKTEQDGRCTNFNLSLFCELNCISRQLSIVVVW